MPPKHRPCPCIMSKQLGRLAKGGMGGRLCSATEGDALGAIQATLSLCARFGCGAVAELMRVLMDQERLGWTKAWDLVTQVQRALDMESGCGLRSAAGLQTSAAPP